MLLVTIIERNITMKVCQQPNKNFLALHFGHSNVLRASGRQSLQLIAHNSLLEVYKTS